MIPLPLRSARWMLLLLVAPLLPMNLGWTDTLGSLVAGAGPVRMAGGRFAPLYAPSPEQKTVQVAPYRLDRLPVTNREFLAFVRSQPSWQRGRAASLFVDGTYLKHWAGPTDPGAGVDPAQPVVFVSWFAARAFCEARGGRLPSEAEWELAAAASETQPDARQDPDWQQRILEWYARPASLPLARVGQGSPNFHGVFDLHGLIWEWVLEFNGTLISSDSRTGRSADNTAFCGAGAVSASDKASYAGFMRYAYRSALEARSTTSALGFRCAYDEQKPGRKSNGGAP